MIQASLCYPNQIYKSNPCLVKGNLIFLIEDSLFFGDAKYPTAFHKKKLVLHRASMKYYEDFLKDQGFQVEYLEYEKNYGNDILYGSMKDLFSRLKKYQIKIIHYLDPIDWALEKRLKLFSKDFAIKSHVYDNPGFLCDNAYLNDFFPSKKKYLQTSFYIQQRKRLDILLDNHGKPIGGKWTFDNENRKKIPKNLLIPELPPISQTKYVNEAIDYVSKKFPGNPGTLDDFIYPTTHEMAEKWFKSFLNERLLSFGPYEDAIKMEEHFLFHSILSPLMNIGLLIPDMVIEQSLRYAEENKTPLNSLEGFVRQIIGWREFMRAIYIKEGVKQRNSNYWKNYKKLPKAFYFGTTGVLPIDTLIASLLNTGYLHHIERLMLLGNFMNLCEIDPNEIYKWFMELFIDAYDWVMVPNLYGMSLNADGGLITTKPYISSSNYVKKMSDYPRGEWCDIWDALYWRFINKHKEKIIKNPRMSMMVRILEKMDNNKLQRLLERANNYLGKLHGN